MTTKAVPIEQSEMEKVFRYNVYTHVLERKWRGLYWKVVDVKPGKLGYSRVYVNGRTILIHRLIYTLVHGDIDEGMHVDHHDGNPENNALSNLQILSNQDNLAKSKNKINPHFHKRDGVYTVQAGARINGKKHTFNFKSFKKKSDAQKMCDAYNGLFTYGKRFYNARLDTYEYWKYCMEEFRLQYCLKTGLPARMNQVL